MSNEYKDWIFDAMQEEVLEQGLMDTITDTTYDGYVEGLKNGKKVKYYVNLTEEGWLCRKQELEAFE
jgi:hypothetical protein